jgi:hypothetical protein
MENPTPMNHPRNARQETVKGHLTTNTQQGMTAMSNTALRSLPGEPTKAGTSFFSLFPFFFACSPCFLFVFFFIKHNRLK